MNQQEQLDRIKIAALRHDLGWTQQVMAQFFRVTVRSVQNWESGHVIPNEYQMAALVQLRNRLTVAKQQRRRAEFVEGLQELMPKILFGAGVFVLLAYLFNQEE